MEYFNYNCSADRERKVFKNPEDAESLLVSILKKLGSFGFAVWVCVRIGVGLGIFGQRHLTLGHNPKGQFFVSLTKQRFRRKPTSLESLIGFLALVFSKL